MLPQTTISTEPKRGGAAWPQSPGRHTYYARPAYAVLRQNPTFLLGSLPPCMFSSFRRFFFSWMCIRMFFSSVHFHLFNHSELLAADVASPCFLFMLSACQEIRQMHQIDSKSPHSLRISPIA